MTRYPLLPASWAVVVALGTEYLAAAWRLLEMGNRKLTARIEGGEWNSNSQYGAVTY